MINIHEEIKKLKRLEGYVDLQLTKSKQCKHKKSVSGTVFDPRNLVVSYMFLTNDEILSELNLRLLCENGHVNLMFHLSVEIFNVFDHPFGSLLFMSDHVREQKVNRLKHRNNGYTYLLLELDGAVDDKNSNKLASVLSKICPQNGTMNLKNSENRENRQKKEIREIRENRQVTPKVKTIAI